LVHEQFGVNPPYHAHRNRTNVTEKETTMRNRNPNCFMYHVSNSSGLVRQCHEKGTRVENKKKKEAGVLFYRFGNKSKILTQLDRMSWSSIVVIKALNNRVAFSKVNTLKSTPNTNICCNMRFVPCCNEFVIKFNSFGLVRFVPEYHSKPVRNANSKVWKPASGSLCLKCSPERTINKLDISPLIDVNLISKL
jgi:hypothetical protein